MEEGQFSWMRTKRKYSSVMTSNNLITSSPTNKNYEEPSSILSWEEQAFAEDAALLGGCIWPPRSYSCSFCSREFRSAQALGGHMNVHRRDRARLKQQPPSSPNHQNHDDQVLYNNELETTHHLHNHSAQNPFTSLGYNNLYPSHIPVCGLAYSKINPNSDPAHEHLASPSSSSLLPSLNSKETLIPLYDSSNINLLHGLHKTNSPLYCSSKSWSNLAEDRDIQKISKGSLDSGGCRGKDKTHDVAVSLNLFLCRAQEADISNCNNNKKKKTHDASSVPIFFPKSSSSVDHRHSHHHMQSQMFEYSPSSIEEIDLELRLGNKSKSKV